MFSLVRNEVIAERCGTKSRPVSTFNYMLKLSSMSTVLVSTQKPTVQLHMINLHAVQGTADDSWAVTVRQHLVHAQAQQRVHNGSHHAEIHHATAYERLACCTGYSS